MEEVRRAHFDGLGRSDRGRRASRFDTRGWKRNDLHGPLEGNGKSSTQAKEPKRFKEPWDRHIETANQ